MPQLAIKSEASITIGAENVQVSVDRTVDDKKEVHSVTYMLDSGASPGIVTLWDSSTARPATFSFLEIILDPDKSLASEPSADIEIVIGSVTIQMTINRNVPIRLGSSGVKNAAFTAGAPEAMTGNVTRVRARNRLTSTGNDTPIRVMVVN